MARKLIILLCFLFLVFAERREIPKIQFEVFASYLPTNPQHLNLEADYLKQKVSFFNDEYFNYLREKGEISGVNIQQEGDFKKIKGLLMTGASLHFNLKDRFSISVGSRFWEGSTKEDFIHFTYDLLKENKKIAEKEIVFSLYELSFEAQNLFVNFHYLIPFKTKAFQKPLTFELYSGIGYIIAKIRAVWNEAVRYRQSEEWETYYLKHLKLGTKRSLSFQAGSRMNLYLGKNFGFYLEGSFFYAKFKGFKGNGASSYEYNNSNGEYFKKGRSWFEEKWFITEEEIKTNWGTFRYPYPINDPSLLPYKTKDFEMKLPPLHFAIGIFLQFI